MMPMDHSEYIERIDQLQRPSEKVKATARAMLLRLYITPCIFSNEDGDIEFEWEENGVSLVLKIGEDD